MPHTASRKTAVFQIGTVESRGFVFLKKEEGFYRLDGQVKFPTLASKKLTIAKLAKLLDLNPRVSKKTVSAQSVSLLSKVLKKASANQHLQLIRLNDENSFLAQALFGQVKLNKEEVGFKTQLLEKMVTRIDSQKQDYLARLLEVSKMNWLDYLANKRFFPLQTPISTGEQLVELTAIRFAFENLKSESKLPSSRVERATILSGRGLSAAQNPGQLLLAYLDGFQPVGVEQVYWDEVECLMALAVLDVSGPLDFFRQLGTVISFSHQLALDETVALCELDLGLRQKQEIVVKSGELMRIPFAPGVSGKIMIGLNRGVELPVVQSVLEVEGGELGIVLDARGRPLRIETDNKLAIDELLKKWESSLT